jgi:hypothetical protein
MTISQTISAASDDAMSGLIAGLAAEFGQGADVALAEQIMSAEAVDFHWAARVEERWIGAYESADDDEIELDLVSIIGRFGRIWFVAKCIVDGDGKAHDIIDRRIFGAESEAWKAFEDGR